MLKRVLIQQPEETDPASYRKFEYHPFGNRSESWPIFFFRGKTERNKTRVYEAYGRNQQDAERCLLLALNSSAYFIEGKLVFQKTRHNTIVPISKATYLELKRKRKK